MGFNIDVILENNHSWLIHSTQQMIKHKSSTKLRYIIEAIKDNSNKHYGIVLCNTLVNITELKNIFKDNKIAFIKLCYAIIKKSVKINSERVLWNIKRIFNNNAHNIVFE